jgi:hypothetical protein
MPAAVLHCPCQQGCTRLSPLNVKSLFRFCLPFCGLSHCLIGLATGLAGAAHAAPDRASSKTTGIALHLRLFAGLRVVGLKKDHVGETAREPSAKPKPPKPRATLQSNVKLEGTAAGFKACIMLHAYSNTNLASDAQQATCSHR